MRILKKDLKNGYIQLKIENSGDVWNLEKVVEQGDLISGKTLRRMVIRRGKDIEKGEKKPVFLKVEAEKIEFHEYSGRLRITGPIKEGPEDIELASYHTIEVEEGSVIGVKKNKWKKWQLDRLQRSMIKQPKILICVLDDSEATFALVSERVLSLTEIYCKGGGKMYKSEGKQQYLGEIISYLKGKLEHVDKIIIAGPGFTKEELLEKIKEEELKDKIILESASHTGEPGIQEVLKRGVIERVVKESRVSEETRYVEKILKELGKDGLVEYGKEEVKRAVELGAVDEILISERSIRKFEEILENVEKKGGKVIIISEEHEAGEKLKNLGGIAALLRYKIVS